MRAIVRALLILLLFAEVATCQTSSASPQQSRPNEPSPELAEASRLAQSVVSLYNAGKYDEALPIAKRAVQIREGLLPKDDDKLVSAVINLGEVQLARHRYTEAQGLFERALHSYERTSGADSPKLGDVLDSLAFIYYQLGRPADTEQAYGRSLAIRERAFPAEHPDVGRSIRNLAEFYQFQGDYKKGEPLYQRLIKIKAKESSSESTADALERYACLLRKTKRLHEAEEMETRALEITNDGGITGELISAGVVNGRALSLFQPPYPYEALAQRASGKVTVRVLINESGTVIRACAIDGPRLLMKASESAAYQSKFSPTMVGGKPVKVSATVVYNFVAR
jgi:tetratricopeptide (TPR) repeat protein